VNDKHELSRSEPRPGPVEADAGALERFVAVVSEPPATRESRSEAPEQRAREIANAAAKKAAVAAASFALPPGPAGWVTILPELTAIWRIQAQMVADIAGAYGREATLTREHMLYCLFRHTAVQALRDVAVRVGERVIVQRIGGRLSRTVLARLGARVTGRSLGRGVSRLFPIVGALGVGAYAYYDTMQVSRLAAELFDKGPPDEEAGTVTAPKR
jgi:hypothetical protein